MKILVFIIACWMWCSSNLFGLILSCLTTDSPPAVSSVPANLVTLVMVQAPQPPATVPPPLQTEHPWERRLRRVELDNIRGAAFAEQATKEAKEIIKDRTSRLEEVERWMKDVKRQDAEEQTAKQKADEAMRKADANTDKVKEVETKVDAVGSPWSWESLVKALGGPAAIMALVVPVLFAKHRNLRKELEANDALPGPNNPAAPKTDDAVPLIGVRGLRNL